jgi:hypothetical protein
VLTDHGIPVAIKSDHSVTNAQFLAWQAAKARHFALTEQEALKAITSVPANAMGMGHRVGSIRKGMDADLVLWNGGSPVQDVGSRPALVIIDGQVEIETHRWEQEPVKPALNVSPESVSACGEIIKKKAAEVYVKVINIGSLHLDEQTHLKNTMAVISLQGIDVAKSQTDRIVASNATLVCTGDDCSNFDLSSMLVQFMHTERTVDADMLHVDLQGGAFMPSPIAAIARLGVVEISII